MDDDVGAELAARLHLHYGRDERHNHRYGDPCLLFVNSNFEMLLQGDYLILGRDRTMRERDYQPTQR